jgi:hypothetical protein
MGARPPFKVFMFSSVGRSLGTGRYPVLGVQQNLKKKLFIFSGTNSRTETSQTADKPNKKFVSVRELHKERVITTRLIGSNVTLCSPEINRWSYGLIMTGGSPSKSVILRYSESLYTLPYLEVCYSKGYALILKISIAVPCCHKINTRHHKVLKNILISNALCTVHVRQEVQTNCRITLCDTSKAQHL